MATEEFKKFLDREFSRQAAKPITDLATPLLQELVNAALWAYRRCEVEAGAEGIQNEHTAAFILFRHIIEMGDGVQVLLANSCGTAAIPVVRAQFEGSLSLSYLLESDGAYVQRSLAWTCCYIHDAILARETLDPGTQRGSQYVNLYEADFAGITESPRDRTPNSGLASERAGLQARLASEQLAPIEAEYQRVRASGRRFPEWFNLFGGPPNRAELAVRITRGAEYRLLYGDFSGVAHGTGMSRYITAVDGQPATEPLRRPDELQLLGQLSALILVRAIREMIHRFRRGENLETWYRRDVQPLLRALRELNVQITPLLEE